MKNIKTLIATITVFALLLQVIAMPSMLISATTNAKVSVENFENANLPTSPVNTGTYSNVTFATTCGSTFQLGTDKFSDGSKSLQVNVSNQANFKYFLNLTDYKNNITENGDLVFYVSLPAGTVTYSGTNATHLANQPDGKYGISIGYAATNGNDAGATKKLNNKEIIYYFKDGSKITKTESGIYPYNSTGEISTTGFEGYVSLSLSDMDLTTTPYLMFGALSTTWGGFLQNKTVYFDDFGLCDATQFTPYEDSNDNNNGNQQPTVAPDTVADFEDLAADWNPDDDTFKNQRVRGTKFYESVFSLDTSSKAQGKNALKLTVGNQGAFEMHVQLKKSNELAPTYKALSFYVNLPSGTYLSSSNVKTGMAVRFNSKAQTQGAVQPTYNITYYFKDGTSITKTENAIYPYDNKGNLTSNGFDGYVSISLNNVDLETNGYMILTSTSATWGEPFRGKEIYFDDFGASDTTSIKLTVGKQGTFEIPVQLKKLTDSVQKNKAIAFNVNLPSGTYLSSSNVKTGMAVRFNSTAGTQGAVQPALNITYYFKDGTTLTKTENAIYPYDNQGNLTSDGFDGYVAVSLKDVDLETNGYMILSDTSATWGEPFRGKEISLDEIIGCDITEFKPYGVASSGNNSGNDGGNDGGNDTGGNGDGNGGGTDTDTGDGSSTPTAPNTVANFEDLAADWNPDDDTFKNQRVRGTKFYESVFSLDTSSKAQGKNALKLTVGKQGAFEMHVQLKKAGEAAPTYKALAFYVKLPAGTYTKNTGEKVGMAVRFNSSAKTQGAVQPALNITYYFKDGTKITKTENAIYPYDNKGNLTSNGFDGYVAISLADVNLETNGYMILSATSATWGEPFRDKEIYFDDFGGCDTANFKPYDGSGSDNNSGNGDEENGSTGDGSSEDTAPITIADFEGLSADWNPDDDTFKNQRVRGTKFYESVFSLDTSSKAQGKNALKLTVGKQGAFEMHVQLKKAGEAAPTYKALAFYVKLPAGTYTKNTGEKVGMAVRFNSSAKTQGAVQPALNITYYFKDGTKITKTENAIYPYDNKGNLTSNGFDGYVAISLADVNLETNGYMILSATSATWGEPFREKEIYFDDFGGCDTANFKPYDGSNSEENSENKEESKPDGEINSIIADFEDLTADWNPDDDEFTKQRVRGTNFYESVFSLDTTSKAQGKNALKLTVGKQGAFEMHVQLKKAGETTPTYKAMAFYVNLPKGTYLNSSNEKIGMAVRFNSDAKLQGAIQPEYNITYYFKDGTKITKTENAIYPYDNKGNLTSKGFDGYVVISLANVDLNVNSYMILSSTAVTWGEPFREKEVYFDDFRGCDTANFKPYDGSNYVPPIDPEVANGVTIVDFESLDKETWDPNKWNDQDSNILCQKFYEAKFSLDTGSRAQGKNSLKIGTSGQGAFEIQVIVPSDYKDASRFDAVALYVDIPMGDYLDAAKRAGIKVAITDGSGKKTMEKVKITYMFPDGATVTKKDQDAIYPYSKNGSISETGFKGYAIISFAGYGIDAKEIKNLILTASAPYKEPLQDTTLYLDDVRFCYAKTFDPFGLYTKSPQTGDVFNYISTCAAMLGIVFLAVIVINNKKNKLTV